MVEVNIKNILQLPQLFKIIELVRISPNLYQCIIGYFENNSRERYSWNNILHIFLGNYLHPLVVIPGSGLPNILCQHWWVFHWNQMVLLSKYNRIDSDTYWFIEMMHNCIVSIIFLVDAGYFEDLVYIGFFFICILQIFSILGGDKSPIMVQT